MTMQTLKDLQLSGSSEKRLKNAGLQWVKHLEAQTGIALDDANFDFDNQLDDFYSEGDPNVVVEYSEVIAWIEWFFNLGEMEK